MKDKLMKKLLSIILCTMSISALAKININTVCNSINVNEWGIFDLKLTQITDKAIVNILTNRFGTSCLNNMQSKNTRLVLEIYPSYQRSFKTFSYDFKLDKPSNKFINITTKKLYDVYLAKMDYDRFGKYSTENECYYIENDGIDTEANYEMALYIDMDAYARYTYKIIPSIYDKPLAIYIDISNYKSFENLEFYTDCKNNRQYP